MCVVQGPVGVCVCIAAEFQKVALSVWRKALRGPWWLYCHPCLYRVCVCAVCTCGLASRVRLRGPQALVDVTSSLPVPGLCVCGLHLRVGPQSASPGRSSARMLLCRPRVLRESIYFPTVLPPDQTVRSLDFCQSDR